MDYLYHYTSIESLALILKNHTIRFTSLDQMDDKQEKMSYDLKNGGQFCYISSWTSDSNESIPMWNMYSSICAGARIKLPKNPFHIYKYTRDYLLARRDILNISSVDTDGLRSLVGDEKLVCYLKLHVIQSAYKYNRVFLTKISTNETVKPQFGGKMQRKSNYDYIEEKLTILSMRVKNKGKLNILDLHMHSENFYRDLLNILYGWSLINENKVEQNVEAIDLIDETNKLIVQVSATATKTKIENSLNKKKIEGYSRHNYRFKFISIAENADKLRNKKYNNSYGILFNPQSDIIDIVSVEKEILNLESQKLNSVYEFIKNELGNTPDSVKFNSDLATIINILADVNLDEREPLGNINMFEIGKKIEFNNLDIASVIIDDYKIFYNQIDKKYREFDKMGLNKSVLVLQSLSKMYVNALIRKKYDNNDKLFVGLIDEVKTVVLNSSNYSEISIEALDACASLLIVDAFMRCKIFKNPEGYSYVIA